MGRNPESRQAIPPNSKKASLVGILMYPERRGVGEKSHGPFATWDVLGHPEMRRSRGPACGGLASDSPAPGILKNVTWLGRGSRGGLA